MSPTHPKHKSSAKPIKSRVPIVNVFEEDERPVVSDLQPAHRPVVVEIEDVAKESMQPPTPTVETSFTAPAPIPPVVEVSAPVTNVEQTLPSFFEQDLKGSPSVPAPETQPVEPEVHANITPLEMAAPQAVVGEIHEAASGSKTRKLIGIILVVLALIFLGIAGLFLYARRLFAPIELPKETSTPIPTIRPTVPPATPVASDSAQVASVSAEMKKKVKVDVLNGTKIAGLAAKQAAVIKKAGYLTGEVGNGKPENAGTIVVAPAYKAIALDIQKLLPTFTFKIEENAKITSVQVTLGDPEK